MYVLRTSSLLLCCTRYMFSIVVILPNRCMDVCGCCVCVYRFKVHVIGDITGALGFPGSKLYARFKIVCNTQHWHVMEGIEEGYTQVDETSVSRLLSVHCPSAVHVVCTAGIPRKSH